jgi:hypothetical protein
MPGVFNLASPTGEMYYDGIPRFYCYEAYGASLFSINLDSASASGECDFERATDGAMGVSSGGGAFRGYVSPRLVSSGTSDVTFNVDGADYVFDTSDSGDIENRLIILPYPLQFSYKTTDGRFKQNSVANLAVRNITNPSSGVMDLNPLFGGEQGPGRFFKFTNNFTITETFGSRRSGGTHERRSYAFADIGLDVVNGVGN